LLRKSRGKGPRISLEKLNLTGGKKEAVEKESRRGRVTTSESWGRVVKTSMKNSRGEANQASGRNQRPRNHSKTWPWVKAGGNPSESVQGPHVDQRYNWVVERGWFLRKGRVGGHVHGGEVCPEKQKRGSMKKRPNVVRDHRKERKMAVEKEKNFNKNSLKKRSTSGDWGGNRERGVM